MTVTNSLAELGLLDSPPMGPAVYFLFQGDTVVYIGASITPGSRWLEHRRDKHFDRVGFLPVENCNLYATERYWIRILAPVYNGVVGRPKNPNSLRSLGVDRHANPRKCFHAQPELFGRLTAYCRRAGVTESDVIRDALSGYLDARKA